MRTAYRSSVTGLFITAEEAKRDLDHSERLQYPEVDKRSQGNCEACRFDGEGRCDYHEGYDDGFEAGVEHERTVR